MSSSAASLNTLIYKGILTLILLGFKRFLPLHATYRPQLATHTPPTRLLKKSLKVSLKIFDRIMTVSGSKNRIRFGRMQPYLL
jgi:hypothetical protein